MNKGLTEPHVLLASSNPQMLMRNLVGILTAKQILKIQKAVDKDVCGLYKLGHLHFVFAKKLQRADWRQKTSRLYYAAYNVRRAVQLRSNGRYSVDSSDHQKIDDLPDALNNVAIYKAKFKNMRDDRNLADYSHLAQESDLLIPIIDMESLVSEFINDAKVFLATYGID